MKVRYSPGTAEYKQQQQQQQRARESRQIYVSKRTRECEDIFLLFKEVPPSRVCRAVFHAQSERKRGGKRMRCGGVVVKFLEFWKILERHWRFIVLYCNAIV